MEFLVPQVWVLQEQLVKELFIEARGFTLPMGLPLNESLFKLVGGKNRFEGFIFVVKDTPLMEVLERREEMHPGPATVVDR